MMAILFKSVFPKESHENKDSIILRKIQFLPPGAARGESGSLWLIPAFQNGKNRKAEGHVFNKQAGKVIIVF
ncbi:MAG: hypothetical protein J5737_01125 [Bacteroidales bacterium]|nr:hypothetical protein [Bacteroidales bacterium]